jgi:zinc protease
MMKKTTYLLGLLLFLYFPVHAQKLSDTLVPNPQVLIGKLANGLTYYIQHNEKPKNRVTFRLVVNAGSICETNDQQGLAHVNEHMCFNGSKHFKKSDLISFIQASGVKFGVHLNAQTSFDETIYKLQMPSDRPSLLDSAMLVLEDWAHNVSFRDTTIDKVRKVVKEEWRGDLGAGERMRKEYLPIILKGSRYAERLPIGKIDVIDTAHYATVKRFYHDWYRPDLMAVFVVGDANVKDMQKLIEKHFSNIPNPKNEKKRVIYGVPDNKAPLIAIATDPETTTNQVVIFYKHPRHVGNTVGYFRNELKTQLFNAMISARLSEIAQKPTAPFMYAGAADGPFIGRTVDAYTGFALAKDNQIGASLKVLLNENKRVKEFGFTPTELERQKKNLLRVYQQQFAEKGKIPSVKLVRGYIQNFLTGEPIPGVTEEYNLAKELIPTITLKEMDQLPKTLITDTNRIVLITAPQKKGVKVPTKADVMAILNAEKTVQVKAYVDKFLRAPLISHKIVPGKIVSVQKTANLYDKWTLSNGMVVFVKPTTFKNDEVLYHAYTPGGSSLIPDDKVAVTRVFSSVIEQSGVGQFSGVNLEKKLSGKVVSLSPFLHELDAGFDGSASPKDLETLLKLQYLYFTAPRQDRDIFAKVMEDQKNMVKHLGASPRMVFYDSLSRAITMHSPRKIVIPTQAQLNSISRQEIYNIYKKQLEPAAGYQIFFVGNINEKTLKPLVEKYLASIPTGTGPLSWKDVEPGFPKGKTNVKVNMGQAPQSTVAMVMEGRYKYNFDNNVKMNVLVGALNIEMLNKLRIEERKIYGVYVSPTLSKLPTEKYTLVMGFGCAPQNVDGLVNSALGVFEKFREKGADAATLEKVKETSIRTRQSAVRTNKYWLNQLVDADFYGSKIPSLQEYVNAVHAVTANDVKKMARKYIDTGHYVLGVLDPKK